MRCFRPLLVGAVLAVACQDRQPPPVAPTPAPPTPVAAGPDAGVPKAPEMIQKIVAAMPAPERRFCTTVSEAELEYIRQREAGANELVLSSLRRKRAGAIRTFSGMAADAPGVHYTDWVVILEEMATDPRGHAYATVKLPCGPLLKAGVRLPWLPRLKTWNNALSDQPYGTLIAPGHVYDALVPLAVGDLAVISGRLFASKQDGFKEGSLTEQGAMEEPEFITKIEAIRPADGLSLHLPP